MATLWHLRIFLSSTKPDKRLTRNTGKTPIIRSCSVCIESQKEYLKNYSIQRVDIENFQITILIFSKENNFFQSNIFYSVSASAYIPRARIIFIKDWKIFCLRMYRLLQKHIIQHCLLIHWTNLLNYSYS